MTFRIVAGLSAKLRMREIVREPMGSPVSIYARTIECRIARSRGDKAGDISFPDNSISVFNYTVTIETGATGDSCNRCQCERGQYQSTGFRYS